MDSLSNKMKISIQTTILVFLLLSSIYVYLPAVFYLDSILLWEFSELMFLLGITLGIIYCILLYINFIFSKSKSKIVRYITGILPSSFMLNSFLWYFYMFFNKLFSESKEDASYYQTIIISFSIYFLITKIVKEYTNLYKIFKNF